MFRIDPKNVSTINVLFDEDGELACVHIFTDNGSSVFVGRTDFLKVYDGNKEATLTKRNERLNEAKKLMIDSGIVHSALAVEPVTIRFTDDDLNDQGIAAMEADETKRRTVAEIPLTTEPPTPQPLQSNARPFYFTFGQAHVHSVNGITFDKDCVARIMATDYNIAREAAFRYFGTQWAFQYANLEDVRIGYCSRGVIPVL